MFFSNKPRVDAQTILGIDASGANSANRTGVEWYAFHLIEELKSVIPADVRVVLYSAKTLRDGLEDLPPNWESKVLRWPPRRLWVQLRLAWELLSAPPDLLFVPSFVPPVLHVGRVVSTVHDVGFLVRPQAYGLWDRLTFRLAAWFLLHRSHRVITVSEFSKAEIRRLCGIDECRVNAVPLGVVAKENNDLKEAVTETLARYGVTEPYFLYVGRLEAKKNLAGLLAAFVRHVETGGRGELILIGRRGFGYEREHRILDRSEAARSRVRELGYVCENDLGAFYAGATALVFLSWYEGFGLTVLEAFTAGTPVICSNVASIPEVAGDAALLVNPSEPQEAADAMALLLSEPLARESLVARGHERAKEFTWRKTAEATWQILKQSKK